MSDNTKVYPSGLTEKEAKEFGIWWMKGFAGFVGLSVIAHFIAHIYVPWTTLFS